MASIPDEPDVTERFSDLDSAPWPTGIGQLVLMWGGAATAAIFFAPLLVAFVSIFFVRHPFVGWSDNVIADAEAVATGHLQYGNPATQFVGAGYTPLYTWIVAGLLKIFWWQGWGSVLSMLAAVTSIYWIVRMLWATSRRWPERLVSASFVIALSLGTLSAFPRGNPGHFPYSALEEARPDQMAWALLVVATTIVFRGLLVAPGPTRKQLIVIGLLLAGSVGAKQTTLVPCIVVAGIAFFVPHVVEGRQGWTRRGWFTSFTVVVAFIGPLLALGIVLQFASHGYVYGRLVQGQLHVARVAPFWQEAGTSLRLLTLPLTALAVLAICVVWSFRTNPERYRRRDVVVAAVAVVVAVCPIPTAILAEIKLGGEANQLVGPVWTLTVGCTVLLILLRPSARRLAASAIACGVLLAGLDPFSQALPGHLGVPDLDQGVTWNPINSFLVAAVNKGEAVYDSKFASLSVSPGDPGYPAGDINDILLAGYTPRWFINNLLTGRYALVAPISEWAAGYDSDMGRYDASVDWKLHLILEKGYKKLTAPGSGAVYYRPGPQLKQLAWMADCFGPYQAPGAGIKVRVSGQGGLVCVDKGDLKLRNAPLPTTDLVMTLGKGTGEVELQFAASPKTLQVTPLDSQDQTSSPNLDIREPSSALARCLVGDGSARTLTVKAVQDGGRVPCQMGPHGAVLDVPVSAGVSTAHVRIQVGIADPPTLLGVAPNGRLAPFTLLNPTPSDVDNL